MTEDIDAPWFTPWPKIARLNREIVITEKIDGTNAAVGVLEDGTVYAQSRSKIITPATPEDKQSDNHGFAAWVQEHADELRDGLGVGVHFGEWWGPGIGKRYKWDLQNYKRGHEYTTPAGTLTSLEPVKRFSLFNTHRWADPFFNQVGVDFDRRPDCVSCVPVLYQGPFSESAVSFWVNHLRTNGSVVVPGSPAEGVVVFHTHANTMFKVTCVNDEMSKGEAEARAKARA